MARDLSKVENRVQRADRKVDRRSGILETADPRQRQAQTFGSMRNARRGDAGASQVLRSLGLLSESVQNAQGVAQKKYEKDQEKDFEQALIDNMTGTTDEERALESEGYRRGIGMARTETRWYQYKAEADVRLQEFIEGQTDPDVNVRRQQLVQYLENDYFGGFVKDPETGEVVDMQHRDGYLLAMEQIQKARPQLLALANSRITERFEGEAIGLFQSSIRERAAAGDVVDINELLARIPPTVPQEKVSAAYGEAVQTTAEELKRTGRFDEAIALVDQYLGYAEEANGIVEVDPQDIDKIEEIELPPSSAAKVDEQPQVSTPQAPSGNLDLYRMPVQGTVSSKFGASRKSGAHNGVDIAVPVGTPVPAAMGGEVIRVWNSDRGGLSVKVRYDDGSVAGFAHLSEQPVSKGQRFNPGEVIAITGNTGRSTGPHLHYTLTRDGKKVDPTNASFGSNVQGIGKPEAPGMVRRERDEDYQPEGMDRSVRDRSFDPSVKLLPELKGRFAPTSAQRTSMLQYREQMVKEWDRFDREETGRIAEETQGAFALRLAGKGPALTDADVESAHRAGTIDDNQAANWYKSIEAAAQAEVEWDYTVEARNDAKRERARKEQAEAIIGNAMSDVLSGKVAPRAAINTVMGNLHRISDPLLRFETLRTVAGMAETLENVNQSTPEAKAFDRNLVRVEDAIGTKLPQGNLIFFNDPVRGWVRINRDEAQARAVSRVRAMRVSAFESIAESGNVPQWADTQSELQEWMQQNFSNRNPNTTEPATAASGRGFGYND